MAFSNQEELETSRSFGVGCGNWVIGHAYYHNGQKNKYNLKIHCQANGIKTV